MRGAGRNKYRAIRTTIGDETFDSKTEAERWMELKILERAGKIADLQRQIPFDLVVNGHLICRYVADYSWADTETGERIVEDCKSPATLTPDFRIKTKLLAALHGIVVSVHMKGKPHWALDVARGQWRRQTLRRRSPATTSRTAASRSKS